MPKETKPDLRIIEGQGIKKKICPYCAEEDHGAPYACPRIASITTYADGEQTDIFFRQGPVGIDLLGFLCGEIEEGEGNDDGPDDAA